MLELTTAAVEAFPTSTLPPSTLYPKNADTLDMMKAKKRLFMMLIHMNHGLNWCCNPAVRSSGVSTCPMTAVA